MPKVKGKLYPDNIYMAVDSDHVCHFYRKDPMHTSNREADEVNIGDLLIDFCGEPSIINPVVFALNVAVLDRGEPFAISQPGAVRSGQLKKHFEDLEGHVVDILETKNGDRDFPFNGVLLTRQGTMVGNATYSVTGECKDGIENHRLVCVNGVFEPEGEEKAGKEEK